MTAYTMAVYSDSPDYIHHFLAYCRENNSIFDVYGFTNLQALNEHLTARSVDILLLPQSFVLTESLNINSGDKPGKEAVLPEGSDRQGNMGRIVCLGEKQDLSADPVQLNMYQPMHSLLEQLTQIAAEGGRTAEHLSSDASFTAIYVLDGNVDTINFILSLSESGGFGPQRILYIDTDRFSGVRFGHGITAQGTMSDLIYHFRTGAVSLTDTLSSCAAQISGIHYLAAPVNPGDLDELRPSEWGTFLSETAEAGNYNDIFICIPDLFRDMPELFGLSRRIYLFSKEYNAIVSGHGFTDSLTGFRAQAFRDYFESRGLTDIFLKMLDGYGAETAMAAMPRETPRRFRKFMSHGKK